MGNRDDDNTLRQLAERINSSPMVREARQKMLDSIRDAHWRCRGITHEDLEKIRKDENTQNAYKKIEELEVWEDADPECIKGAVKLVQKQISEMERELCEELIRQRAKERWESYPIWSLNEAACLLLDIPPEAYPSRLEDVTSGSVFNHELIEPVQEMKRKLVRATQAGELKTTTSEPLKDEDCLLFSSVPEEKKLFSTEVRSWYRRLRGEQEPGERVTIPAPSGTTWQEITIRIVNDERIEITYPGGTSPWTRKKLGFENKRLLWMLFELFAEGGGQIKNTHEMRRVKANISNLRKHIKELFPSIDGDPIKRYSVNKGWSCNFNISSAEQQKGHYR